ncbi:MAG TPA: sulfatase-like hydrolase/transferase [Pyrinomonadaceae bacterium]
MRLRAAQRDFVAAVSLANVCFISSWRALLYPRYSGYHLEELPGRIQHASVILCVLSFAVLLWWGMTLARRSTRARAVRLARVAFVLLAFVALNGIRMQFEALTLRGVTDRMDKLVFWASLAGAILAGVGVFAWRPRLLVFGSLRAVMILSAFVPVTFSQATWALVSGDRERTTSWVRPTPAGQPLERPARRAVWIIFDELDFMAAFGMERVPVELPELRRLRDESFFALDARPPADTTLKSIPSLLTGRLVSEARAASYKELSITFAAGGGEVRWSEQANIFTKVREMGGATAAVGWYHPYCRVLGDSLDLCTRDLIPAGVGARELSFGELMVKHARSLWGIVPLAQRLNDRIQGGNYAQSEIRREHASVYARVSAAAANAAADRRLSLTLLHFPVPHDPPIYDRLTRGFTYATPTNYFDNLALADSTLGELRRLMERAGLWDETIVLVSSDHWWRVEMWREGLFWTGEEQALTTGHTDRRVPFILKLGGRNTHLGYEPAFNTVLSQDLLLALLRGEMSTPSEVAEWIDSRRQKATRH